MSTIALYILFSIMGIVLGFIGGYFSGGIMGVMMSLFSGMMIFMPIMMIIGYAKNKGFLPLFKNLKEFEKYAMFPDTFGKLKFLVMNQIYDGMLFKKGIGLIDDKGTEFAFGNDKGSFALPRLGVTIDFKNIHYNSLLQKDDGIKDYDEAIRQYLGDNKYQIFLEKFRKNPKPDIYDINQELQWLKDQEPNDSLEKTVFGETVDFRDNLQSLKYIYNPISMENAVDTVKIWTKREQLGYKDVDKQRNLAKTVVTILFAVMVFLIVMSVVDWSQLGGLFGM